MAVLNILCGSFWDKGTRGSGVMNVGTNVDIDLGMGSGQMYKDTKSSWRISLGGDGDGDGL